MDQRISFITIAAHDLDRSRAFYVDGLGWVPELDVPGEVVMLPAGDRLILSLWAQQGFEAEVGPVREGDGVVGVTLAHNVATRAEVDEVLALAAGAGAHTTTASERDWGGYTGYFLDPDGIHWEVAWNPGPVGVLVVPETDPAG